MLRISRPVVLAFSLLCSTVNLAQTTSPASPTPARDPQAIQLLARSLATIAGTGPVVVDSVSVGSLAYSDGRSGPITIETMGTSLRQQMTVPGSVTVHVVNNGTEFVATNGGRALRSSWQSQYQRPEHIFAASRMADYTNPNTQVVYVGVEQVQGAAAHHVRISTWSTDPNSPGEDPVSEFHAFLDAQTLLPVKTQHFDFSPRAMQNRSLVETYYADYRFVSGVRVLFRMTAFLQGQQLYQVVLSQAQINVGVSANDFE